MKLKTTELLVLSLLILAFAVFDPIVYAEKRKVLSRTYLGLEVEIYAPYQCYPSDVITVNIRIEALQDVKNASATLLLRGTKSLGQNPWDTSFIVFDVTDFPSGTQKEEAYNITIPSDIDPGLTYGILFLDWSIYSTSSWEPQWDKASFRMTYVKNEYCENLQTTYNSVLSDSQNTRTLMYVFLTTTIISLISTTYFARKKLSTRS